MRTEQKENQIAYLDFSDAQELVERIAKRAEQFNHTMCENEKEAMAELLSDVGVKVSDLINVSSLADNYAINAEIVTEKEMEGYSTDPSDALFHWIDNDTDEKTFCMRW